MSQKNKAAAAIAVLEGKCFVVPKQQPNNLAEYIYELVLANPDGKYTEIDRYGRTIECTFGELFNRAKFLAPALRARKSDSRFQAILCFESILDFVAAGWACLICGINWVPMSSVGINSKDGYFVSRIAQLLESFEDRLILTDAQLGSIVKDEFDVLEETDIVQIDSLETTRPLKIKPRDLADIGGDVLITTSGTTGEPKLAVLDSTTLMNRFFDGYSLNHRVSLYSLAHHSVAGLRMLLPLGQQVIYLHPLRLAANPKQWFGIVDQYRVTDAGMSSSIAAMLTREIEEQQLTYNMSSLERLGFGAEIIVPELVHKLLNYLREFGMPQISISLVYSMTETGPICRSIMSDSDFETAVDVSSGMLSIDECAPGWSLRITDEQNRIKSQGKVGQIQVYSDGKLFSGYQNQSRADFFTADGWFKTGDFGRIQNNKLILLGRENTVININARKIACEEIDRVLHGIKGIDGGTAFSAPYRTDGSHTDEIAIFFTPDQFEAAFLRALHRDILSVISNAIGVSVGHLIAVNRGDIERTDTLKIKRSHMIEKYRRGAWNNLLTRVVTDKVDDRSSLRQTVQHIWVQSLNLGEIPESHQNFSELGGDSLGAARLVFAIEDRFNLLLPLDDFFREATIENMVNIINRFPQDRQEDIADSNRDVNTEKPLDKTVAAYVATWNGKRLFSNSMIIGQNVSGCKVPIFWVFGGAREFNSLAKALGKDQPLYGMRSCHRILPAWKYSIDKLQAIIDRYLWELLAITEGKPFYLGGNCAGGIIALLMARQLVSVNRQPKRLLLLEWSFEHGNYKGPVEFIYGEKSYTAAQYASDTFSSSKVARAFPNYRISSVPGEHARFFDTDQVTFLGNVLKKATSENWIHQILRNFGN